MTNAQLLLAMGALFLTGLGLLIGFAKFYLDAKIDPIAKNVDMLVQYMISHEGKITRLEERTGK